MTRRRGSPHRRVSAVLALLAGVLAAVLLLPGQAFAHAELLRTDPLAGAVLDTAPTEITLTFSEPVEISLGAVRLFDGSGAPVEVGAAKHPAGSSESVTVSVGALGNGSYVVDWRVVSADSHPVQGAFTFQIGQTADLQPGIVTDIISRDHTSRPAGIGLGITRWLIIVSIAIVFGGLIAIGWGVVEATRLVRTIVLSAAIVGAFAGLLQLPLEVGYATGRSLTVLFEPSAWRAAFDTRIGAAWLIRAGVVAIVGAALVETVRNRERWWWRAVAVTGLLAVGVVSAYGGHGATGRWIPVGVVATALHVGAMAVWLGGLLMVLIEFRSFSAEAARRFSAIALVMIAVVVASGVVQSIRQLGSIDALTNTSYGTLLIWKLVFVVVLLLVAVLSRRTVRRAAVDAPRLRRSIVIETAVAVAIVVTTSLLMASNPSQVVASKPFSVTLTDNDYLASITIEPGRTGPNEMHIYLSNAQSSLLQPDDVHVEITDPSREVAAIEIPLARSGAGHFTTSTATFPYATTWTLTVTARYNTFDEITFVAHVPIR